MRKEAPHRRPSPRLRQFLGAGITLAVALLVTTASAQTLVVKWRNGAAGATANRQMVYNPTTGNLLLVQSGQVLRYKSSDGTSAGGNMNVTGVSGGTLSLDGIAVASDGAIYACNYVIGSSANTVKIYTWANEDAAPTVLCSFPAPGTTSDRFGAGLCVYGSGDNAAFVLGGTTTSAAFVYKDAGTWTIKVLTCANQSLSSGAVYIDYNASGFTGQYRILGKTGQTSGNLYAFNPTAASPIAMTVVKNYTSGNLMFVANGTHEIAYDPVTGLIGTCSRVATASPYTYKITLNSTLSPNSLISPLETSSDTPGNATAGDGGAMGAASFGLGALYTSSSGPGSGLNAYDITAFLVSAPATVIKQVGDSSATLSAVFGGSQLSYQWKKGSTVLSDDAKYTGTATASLVINNLDLADAEYYTVTATGVNASTASATIQLIVNGAATGSKTWNGGSLTDDNWSSAANWNNNTLNPGGDTVYFGGTTRLTPLMDGNYDVNGVTFNADAGAFNISAAGGMTLSLSGGVTNSSTANDQTLSLPIALNGSQNFKADTKNLIVNGAISGSAGMIKLGSQGLTLGGASGNTFNGLTVSQGAVTCAKAGGNAVSGNSSVASGAILALSASDQIDDATVLDLQTGNGTLSLASAVTETIRGFSTTGSFAASAVSGEAQLGANAQLTVKPVVTSAACAVKITAATPAGTKFIVDSGATGGEVRWTPNNMVNTFEKLVIQNGGRLRCGHGGNAWLPQDTMLGAVPGSFMQDQITISSGTLGLNSSLAANPPGAANTVVLNANRGLTIAGIAQIETFQNVVIPGKITGGGTLQHVGGADLALLGQNDYLGGTYIGSGSITVNNPAALGTGTIAFKSSLGVLAVSVNGLTITNALDLSAVITNTFGTYFNATNFTCSGDVDLGNSGTNPHLQITNANSVITFSGVLWDSLGLTKSGLGTAVLSGANTYGGDTEIMNGTLLVNNTTGSGTSGGTVNVTPTGTLGGTGTVGGMVLVYGGVAPGASVGTLTTGNQTWYSGGSYTWQVNDAAGTAGGPNGWDKLVVNGQLQIAASSGAKFRINLASLNGAVAGNAANYNNAVPQTWVIASASSGITGFDPAAFEIVTSSFSNPLGAAYFTVETANGGNDLVIRQNVGTVGTGTGLLGDYYNLPSFTEPPTSMPDPPVLERLDATVNFDWGTGSPGAPVTADYFGVRWMGKVQPMYDATYTFIAATDDGVRLWVDGQQIINNWILKAPTDTVGTPITLVGGQKYDLVMEYFEGGVGAVAVLKWQTPSRGPEVVPQTQLYPASTPPWTVSRSPDGTQVTISWAAGTYKVQTATDVVNGPWTTVATSSPYTFTIDANATTPAFYRMTSQ